MKKFLFLSLATASLSVSPLLASNGATSLENFESLGESVEAEAKDKEKEKAPPAEGAASEDPPANGAPVPVPTTVVKDGNQGNAAAGGPPVANTVEANVVTKHEDLSENVETPTPSQEDFMRPATDMSGGQAIDIQSQIKKITEPNLFSGAPVNPGTLRNLATGEAPEEYLVREGDTLFDICDQLIDEADYWPKLWAFNPTIENPHFVYPGMRLRFYPGDEKSPPFLQVVTEDDILPVAKGEIVEAELVREDINGMLMRSEIPPVSPVITGKDLDAILRVDHMFAYGGGTYTPKPQSIIIPAFIVSEEFSELGVVVGGSAGSFLVDRGQQLILRDEDGLEAGTTYSVVRKGGKLKNSNGDTVGIRYDFVAQVKVTTADENDEKVFKGDVVFNRVGVEPGDLIVSYRSVRRSIPLQTSPDSKGSSQEVVDFTEPMTEIGGRGSFVFLDQTEGKLEEQKTYRILQNVKVAASRFLRDELPNTDSRVANVYILDASGSAALGYLTQDSLEVRLGDRVSP